MRAHLQNLCRLAAALLIVACDGQEDAKSLGVGEVEVTLAGAVRSIETGLPIEGIAVELVRDEPQRLGLEPAVVESLGATDAEGRFGPSKPVVIEPEDYRYALRLRDASEPPRYQPNSATTVFALVASDLRFDTLSLTPIDQRVRTVVVGTVLDARTDAPLAGVKVTLTRPDAPAPLHEAVSGADGRFAFEKVISETLRVDFDGSGLSGPGAPQGYIVEYAPFAPDKAELLHELGATRLVPRSERDDLSVLLDWQYQSPEVAPFERVHNLDVVFSLAAPTVDFNHLFGQQIPMGRLVASVPSDASGVQAQLDAEVPVHEGDLSVAPASGFGAGTGYWPAFLGGDDAARVSVGGQGTPAAEDACEGAPGRVCRASSGGEPLVELLRRSANGAEPESLVFRQRNPFAALPKDLAYHYTAGDGRLHYPTGVAVLTVVARPDALPDETEATDPRRLDADIHRSRAVAKVYRGSTFVGRFDIGRTTLPPGENSNRTWTPFVVEYGFTSPDPQSDDELYFRVVPFTAIKQSVQRRRWMYEDFSAQASNLRHCRDTLDFDGVLYAAGLAEEALPASERFGLWYLGQGASAGDTSWHWLEAEQFTRGFELLRFGLLNGAFVASFRDVAAPEPAWFGPFTGSEGTWQPCPAAESMEAVAGDFLLATREGLRSGVDCADLARPHLVGAPQAELTAVTQHRFAAGTRMVLGGRGIGLWSSELPDPDAEPPTTAAWAAGAPGLAEAGADGPPAGATITVLRSVGDTLYVGTETHGVFAVRRADGDARDVWSALTVAAEAGPPEGPPEGPPAAVTGIAVAGERVLFGTSAGLLVLALAGDGTARLDPVEPALPIEHLATYGDVVYLFTGGGVVRYR